MTQYRPRDTHCPMCGGLLAVRELEHEDRPRLVCTRCLHIHYINPKVVGATIPERDGRVLLIRRAIEPRAGMWSYPAGFVEFGESAEEGAVRETLEEAGVTVDITSLLGVYSRPNIGIVVIVYRARTEEEGIAGSEVLETSWFTPEEIPWEQLAFDTTEWALRDWVAAVNGRPPDRPLTPRPVEEPHHQHP